MPWDYHPYSGRPRTEPEPPTPTPAPSRVEPAGRPRRVETGDRIRSSDFVEGMRAKDGAYVLVGTRHRGEVPDAVDPSRGEAIFEVVEAAERRDRCAGFPILRGPDSQRWEVRARRVLADGGEEVIVFNQFCTCTFGPPDYVRLVPVVEFVSAEGSP